MDRYGGWHYFVRRRLDLRAVGFALPEEVSGKRLDRTERCLPFGTADLIARNWDGVKGPSSGG